VAVDTISDSLFIVDTNNSRVLRFSNRNSLTPLDTPISLFGQSNWTQTSPNGGQGQASASVFAYPTSACVDENGTLFVSDTGNNRIMVFPQASIAVSGALASQLLGQENFTVSYANQGLSVVNAEGVSNPSGLSCSSEDCWAVDPGNNR